MVYEWGSRSYAIDPNVVGAEIERIACRYGAATSAAIVEEARPDEAPLHSLFTWDDETAAESWRRQEARVFANSLVVVEVEDDGREQRAPAFYHVNYDQGGEQVTGYQSVTQVVSNDDARESAATELLHHLRGLERRYARLGDLIEPVRLAVAKVEEMADAA